MGSKLFSCHDVTHPMRMIFEGTGYRPPDAFAVGQNHSDPQVWKVFSQRSQGWSHISISGDQYKLLEAVFQHQARLTSRKTIHADGDMNVRFLFFKFPDVDLIKPGCRGVLVDETRSLA